MVGCGEREAQEGGDICILMFDSFIRWQKPTQHCKEQLSTLHGLRSTIMKVSYHTIVMVIMMINGMVLGTFLVIYIYKLLKFLCIVILFKLIKSL